MIGEVDQHSHNLALEVLFHVPRLDQIALRPDEPLAKPEIA